jgi:hypothetical protein
MNSSSLCSLAGRYDNRIPTRFLAPIDFSKIPAQNSGDFTYVQYECLAIASQLELESLVLVQGFSEVLQILAIEGLAPGQRHTYFNCFKTVHC